MSGHRISRRSVLAMLASIGAIGAASRPAWSQDASALLTRPIPHSPAESLPVVGVGTAAIFGSGSERAGLTAVIKALVLGGGSVIDTAPSYGEAENAIGDILAQTGLRPRIFIATKLEAYQPGRLAQEARASLERLQTAKLDLLQLHNVHDPGQSLAELNGLKDQGICRHTGITTTYAGAYGAVESILKREKPDFLEIDYAIDNRVVEARILPAARDAGTAVLVALPLGRGGLFRKVRGKPLPDFAREIDCKSWGQFFLKFLLGNPAVTAVIPGTDKAEHMIDNLGAGRGRLPDEAMRTRMAQYIESLG